MEDLEGTSLKGYQLQDRIGSGGYGAVYRARQTTLAREVAVKIILPGFANDPDFIRRFETEAGLIARLEHPHITPLYDFWRDPQGAYLVMRYLRGGSLRQTIESSLYELEAASQLLDQIAAALDYAHRHHVIHRDIKPGNILLDEDGNAYLADFGIAKNLAGWEDQETAANAVLGSLNYVAPEQLRGEPVTSRTDIYSLGVTLYEIITGEHPFPAVTTIERLYKHINNPVPQIKMLSNGRQEAVNEVIQKATAKDPGQRYQDPLALAVAFRQAIGKPSADSGSSIVEQLTMREQEILSMIAQGMSNRQIADELVVTVGTVKWHITQLYKKLGARSRVQAIVRARELHLIVGDTSEIQTGAEDSRPAVLLPEPENPYKGLRAFQVTDARIFFGRDELLEKLAERMSQKDPYFRFLAIVGPSGSGKSSLVRAGLIASLWRGAIPGSQKWFVVDMIPGAHPFDKLETALIRVAANQAGNLRQQLQRDERGLLRVADLILPADDTELLVVVDQFEELFTLVEEEGTRQRFLDLLRVAVSDVRSRVRVVVTLRADYYDRPLHYPEFGELVRSRMETLLPLSARGLERAIRGPAEHAGVTFEQGLVEQIVSQMNYQAGALPLLQYALTELFDRRDGLLLTYEAYQKIGGAVGALANRAEEIYGGLDAEAQELARQMFLRLVTLGEGAEDARRRATTAELLSLTRQQTLTGNTDLMEEVIEQFAAYRLLSLDHDPETRQPTVEVAHEAILREWERLREWLNDSREDIRQERAVGRAAGEWNASKRDPSYLLRGARLEQVQTWAQTTELTLTPLEEAYIAESLAQRERDEVAESARQTHEARLEQRSRAFLRGLVVVFALAALVSGALGLFALRQRGEALASADEALANFNLAATSEAQALVNEQQAITNEARAEENAQLAVAGGATADAAAAEAAQAAQDARTAQQDAEEQRAIAEQERETAEEQARLATSRELAAAARSNLEADPELSILLAQQALETVHTTEAEAALHQAVQSSYTRRTFTGASDLQTFWLAYAPDGRRIFTSGSGGAEMWDTATGENLFAYSPASENEIWISGATFSPDGSYLVLPVVEWQGDEMPLQASITFLDAGTGDEILTFPTGEADIQEIVFNPSGTQFAAISSSGGSVTIWDLAATLENSAGQEVLTLCCHDADYVFSANYSPDGALIATVGADDTVRVWDTAAGEERLVISDIEPTDAVFTPDGQYIAVGDDREVLLFDAQSGERHASVPGPGQNFVTLLFSPDGTRLAASNFDGKVRLWPYADGELAPDPLLLSGHEAMTGGISFSPDGKLLASGSIDGTARVWDVSANGGGEFGQYAHGNRAFDVDFSPDGSWLVSTGFDGTARIWDTAAREERFILEHPNWVIEADIHPNGRTLATSGSDGAIRIWDARTGEELRVIEAHEVDQEQFFEGVKGIAYSPDGERLASGGADGVVRLWDTASGEQFLELAGHEGPVHAVDFSADGRWLVSAGDDGTVKVWDPGQGRELWTLTGDPSVIFNMTFSADGSRLAASHENGQVIIWSFPDPEGESNARPEIILQITDVPWGGKPGFSPDGSLLAVPNRQGITLYDAETGEAIIELEGGASTTTYSPDGRMIATAGIDGLVRILAANLDSLLELAETRVTRLLTDEECRKYLHLKACPQGSGTD